MSIQEAYRLVTRKSSAPSSSYNPDGWDWHDWFWGFRMRRTRAARQQQHAATAGAADGAAASAAAADASYDPAAFKQPSYREKLRGQIAGLKSRAVARAAALASRQARAAATASDCDDEAGDSQEEEGKGVQQAAAAPSAAVRSALQRPAHHERQEQEYRVSAVAASESSAAPAAAVAAASASASVDAPAHAGTTSDPAIWSAPLVWRDLPPMPESDSEPSTAGRYTLHAQHEAPCPSFSHAAAVGVAAGRHSHDHAGDQPAAAGDTPSDPETAGQGQHLDGSVGGDGAAPRRRFVFTDERRQRVMSQLAGLRRRTAMAPEQEQPPAEPTVSQPGNERDGATAAGAGALF